MSTSTSTTQQGVNVAKESTSGHFLKNCNVNEVQDGTFVCNPTNEGPAVLETKNHGTVTVDAPKGFAVFTQVELNNFTKVFEKARD
jgi:formylmethanofuran dehydrogenase subunit D